MGSELLRGRFEERRFRGFLGFLGLTVLVEEPDANESEASLIVVIWRDLRISSKGMPELLELGVPVVGCSGTMLRFGAERVCRRVCLKRPLRLIAVVTPDGSLEIVVGFATRGTWREPEHD